MLRPTWAEVDLKALEDNFQRARSSRGINAPVWPALPGEAYGHGLVPVAQKLAGLEPPLLAVGNVEEGVRLRRAGIEKPLLVLDGALPGLGMEEAAAWDLACALPAGFSARLRDREPKEPRRELQVYLRLEAGDTGLPPVEDAGPKWGGVPGMRLRGLLLPAGVGCPEKEPRAQVCPEKQAPEGASLPLHLLAGQDLPVGAPDWADGVGLGAWLFGLVPGCPRGAPLPVLSWKTRVAFVKDVPAGTGVSYGLTYQTPWPTRLATLPVGYADGLKRGLSNRMEVLVRGQRVPQVGRICMDQCVVDVGAVPGVEPGEPVTLLGTDGEEEIRASEWSERSGLSPLDHTAALGPRVARSYREGERELDGYHMG